MNWTFLFLFLFFIGDSKGSLPDINVNPPPAAPGSSNRLAPCQACRAMVKSFELGMEKTAKGHYGGGDTAWEEAHKKDYKNSELRLVEIQEHLCQELSTGKDQCHELASDVEHHLEDWWYKHRNAGQDLYTWLCIDTMLACCPDHHFGLKCDSCPGHPGPICSEHGKCKGAGTRKGNGECSCDIGYSGKLCNECSRGYYEAFKDGDKLLCSPCHKACQGGCTGAGIKACNSCREGWVSDEEVGCLDLNECLIEPSPCKMDEFCVNTEGSYSCIECDKACDGCIGDGPDSCNSCAHGFQLVDQFCVDATTMGRTQTMNTTRYLTYLGLCLAACIIFQKNVMIASIVGIGVGIYISASEYLLRMSNQI